MYFIFNFLFFIDNVVLNAMCALGTQNKNILFVLITIQIIKRET